MWVMDHFFQLPPLGGPDQPMLEAYTLLGALAARTERVQLGTLVTGVTYRNPGLLAKIITTLDIISKGRAILGIGGAWYDVEHEALGFEYPGDKVRLDRLEEAVQICRAMFRQDHVDFSGEHYQLRDARNLPQPIQDGRAADHDRRRRREADAEAGGSVRGRLQRGRRYRCRPPQDRRASQPLRDGEARSGPRSP